MWDKRSIIRLECILRLIYWMCRGKEERTGLEERITATTGEISELSLFFFFLCRSRCGDRDEPSPKRIKTEVGSNFLSVSSGLRENCFFFPCANPSHPSEWITLLHFWSVLLARRTVQSHRVSVLVSCWCVSANLSTTRCWVGPVAFVCVAVC